MSQNDFDIADQGINTMVPDVTAALKALASCSSGATEPATTYAYMLWYDTTNDVLKQRNGADSGWIEMMKLSGGLLVPAVGVVYDTTPQLGGPLDTNSQPIDWSKGADVASAAELLVLRDGNQFDVTGTTTIASIENTADAWPVGSFIKLQFDATVTMTHSASLSLIGAADITFDAGEWATFQKTASGTWRMSDGQYANATQAEAEGGTQNTRPMTSLRTAQAIAKLAPAAVPELVGEYSGVSGASTIEVTDDLSIYWAVIVYFEDFLTNATTNYYLDLSNDGGLNWLSSGFKSGAFGNSNVSSINTGTFRMNDIARGSFDFGQATIEDFGTSRKGRIIGNMRGAASFSGYSPAGVHNALRFRLSASTFADSLGKITVMGIKL